jgi:hypothetical protein
MSIKNITNKVANNITKVAKVATDKATDGVAFAISKGILGVEAAAKTHKTKKFISGLNDWEDVNDDEVM